MVSFTSRESERRRSKFNKPYSFIKLKYGDIFDCYSPSNFDKKVILWTDFEKRLNRDRLDNLTNLCAGDLIKPGSIIILTFNIQGVNERNLPEDDDDSTGLVGWDKFQDYFNREFGTYFAQSDDIGSVQDISNANMGKAFFAVVYRRMEQAMRTRRQDGLWFTPIFNLSYADGQRMQTIGFMVDEPRVLSRIDSRVKNFGCLVLNKEDHTSPVWITSPVLTKKERYDLSHNMKKYTQGTKPIPYELDQRLLDNYFEYYQYYPEYFEGI